MLAGGRRVRRTLCVVNETSGTTGRLLAADVLSAELGPLATVGVRARA